MITLPIKKDILHLIIFVGIFLITGCSENDNKAKQHHFTVGLATNNPNGIKNVLGFQEAMTKLNYVVGENIDYRFAGKPTKGKELEQLLQEMIDHPVDLIFTAGTPTGVTAHKLTKDAGIPVVFGVIADPVRAGVIKNLDKPGGNITGVMISQNHARRLQLFLEIVPDIKRLFVPYNPDDSAPSSALSNIKGLAKDLKLEIIEGQVKNNDEVTNLFNTLPADIDAIFMLPDSTVNRRQKELLDLAVKRHIPVSGPTIIQVEKGALTAYGIVHKQAGAQAATIADQVLKGTLPGNIPVQTAEFYLGVNLKTAAAIGLEVPDSILQQSHTIIRENAK